MGNPLNTLAEQAARDFPHLLQARTLTEDGLRERREQLSLLPHDPATAIVLMGSWGRAEVTAQSDDDFMLLVNGEERDDVQPSCDAIRDLLDRAPGGQGIFGKPVFSRRLIRDIGLKLDDNPNLTHRMLFLLESTPVTGDTTYEAVLDEVLNRYLNDPVKPYRPPRFLLNDVVRYWRTICVDFAGKEFEGPEKWGLRNAKLRTSRKILFAGGLLPILECHRFDGNRIRLFLEGCLAMPPVDRIAQSFLDHEASDAGARTLGAYDEFVGLMGEEAFRRELRSVTRESADFSAVFAEIRRIGKDLEAGLLALLYETRDLPRVVRQYAIF